MFNDEIFDTETLKLRAPQSHDVSDTLRYHSPFISAQSSII